MKLKISPQLSLPQETVTSTLVIYGGKGMGKTNLGSVLVEELHRCGLRFSVLDPLGVWWGLRHSKDGKGPGIECLILGGIHGDIPIEPTGGAVAADLVVDESVSVIIDFSRKPSGEMWSIGEKIRFLTDYGYRLFQRQGEIINSERREPIFQVLDEAARYIPQIIPAGSPDLARCMSAWNQLVEEGRNVGIGVCLLTQRSARMNKSVSELADAMIAFRTVGPNSVDAIVDWLGEHVPKAEIRKHVETLRALPRGECLVVSPGWLSFEAVVQIRERETFDSSATPKPGERGRKVSGPGAKPNLEKYAARMKATIEAAKANDPKHLKARIVFLEGELKENQSVHTDPLEVEKARQQGYLAGQQSRAAELNGLLAIARKQQERLQYIADKALEVASAPLPEIDVTHGTAQDLSKWGKVPLRVPFETALPEIATSSSGKGSILGRAVQYHERVGHVTRSTDVAPSELSRPQRDLLRALAESEAIGRDAISRSWLAFLAGVSPKSSGFEKNVSTLSSKGLVGYPQQGKVALTPEGRSIAGSVDSVLDTDAMFERVYKMLSSPQAYLLKILRQAHPRSMSREELAERAGVSSLSSGYEKNVSTLSSRELVTYPDKGMVRCADWLFIE